MDSRCVSPPTSAGRKRRTVNTRALGLAVATGAGIAGIAAIPAVAEAATSNYCYLKSKNNGVRCQGPTNHYKYSANQAAIYPNKSAGYDPCVSYTNSAGQEYGPTCAVSTGQTGIVDSYFQPYKYKTLDCFHVTGGDTLLLCTGRYP